MIVVITDLHETGDFNSTDHAISIMAIVSSGGEYDTERSIHLISRRARVDTAVMGRRGRGKPLDLSSL